MIDPLDDLDPLVRYTATRITIERDGDEPGLLWTARSASGEQLGFGYLLEGAAFEGTDLEDRVIKAAGEDGVRVTDVTVIEVVPWLVSSTASR